MGDRTLFVLAFLLIGLGLGDVLLAFPAWMMAPWVAILGIFAVFTIIWTGFGFFLL